MTSTAYRFFGPYVREEVSGLPPVIRAKLTRRQAEVCDMIAVGKTNKQISAALKLQECTVRLYVMRILERLGLDRDGDPRVAIARAVVLTWAESDAA